MPTQRLGAPGNLGISGNQFSTALNRVRSTTIYYHLLPWKSVTNYTALQAMPSPPLNRRFRDEATHSSLGSRLTAAEKSAGLKKVTGGFRAVKEIYPLSFSS